MYVKSPFLTKQYFLTRIVVNIVSSNTFPVPEIVYNPLLIFSPHVVLLRFIFAN